MNRPEKDIVRVILKYIGKEKLNAEETAALKAYLTGSMANRRKFVELTKKQALKGKLSDFSGITDDNTEAVWRRIQEKLREDKKQETAIIPIRGHSFTWIRWAAAAILIITAGGLLYLLSERKSSINTIKPLARVQERDVLPGGNKAILILGDGSTITLDSARDGRLGQQGSVNIRKTGNGQLTYSKGQTSGEAVLYNVLKTPRAGQYHVVLQDGTGVWLNNASGLKYPASFTGAERKVVLLSGEAYFEVARDKTHPFRVLIPGGNTVEVLGTHFNINSYEDEAALATTLLEGSIKFNNNVVLRPGEEIQQDKTGATKLIKEADTTTVVAWKNNMFWFQNADLPAIMRQVSRWYDVDVIFEETISRRYDCLVPRNLPLSKLFAVLEKTGGVRFEITGRVVKVRSK